jgi:hypothetical protein
MKGVLLGWFIGLVVPVRAALVCPVQNILFLTIDYFNSFVPIAQLAGQAVVQGRPSLSMCLWSHPLPPLMTTPPHPSVPLCVRLLLWRLPDPYVSKFSVGRKKKK